MEQQGGDSIIENRKFVISVDVGTTNLRAQIFDHEAKVCGAATFPVDLVHPQAGWVEIEPLALWDGFVKVVRFCLEDANLVASQISCIAVSTQRSTFTTWNRETGEPFHNFITWNDLRSDNICKSWNKSFKLTMVRFFARLAYFFTKKTKFLAASIFRITTFMVVSRLIWVLQNISEVRDQARNGLAVMGTVDTWLLWKLTGGKMHATEPSNACVTGLFDPFEMSWGEWAINLFDIPRSMLPVVKSTCGEFGETDTEIFGAAIPISAMIGDQQASTFGECCFSSGDVKCTMGTGAFMLVNTGQVPHASFRGVYPVVGWKIGNDVTYLAEGKTHDCGTIIEWAQRIGMLKNPDESSTLATSVPDSGGVFFIPAFHGMQLPFNDNQATAGCLGITVNTTRAHMVRAILESLAFSVKEMFEVMREEANFELLSIRVDGGVANNNFLMQLIADLTERPVDRPLYKDMSCLGAAFIGGLSVGVWSDKAELIELRKTERFFEPRNSWENQYRAVMAQWKRAAKRCLRWNSSF